MPVQRVEKQAFLIKNKNTHNMPTPRENESEQEFINRCIPIVIEEGTAQNPGQAYAICASMYEQGKDKK